MDQLSTRGIPEGRFCHIDFDHVGIALELQLDGVPMSTEVAISIVDVYSDTILCAAA
jgi:hypothetical protein